MAKFTIIEARRWVRDDGKTASIYGAAPYVSESEKSLWKIKSTGWTLRNERTNTVGLSGSPFKTREEAEARLVKLRSLGIAD